MSEEREELTASQVASQLDVEKRHCYEAAGYFLEHANARRLQDDLADWMYKVIFENKLDKGGK